MNTLKSQIPMEKPVIDGPSSVEEDGHAKAEKGVCRRQWLDPLTRELLEQATAQLKSLSDARLLVVL